MGQFQGTMPWRIVAVSKAGEDEPTQAQNADCSYWCEHQTLYYRLDSGKANEYYLPDPVCVECIGPMSLDTLFGNKTKFGRVRNAREEL